jgi:hypothetical protein
VVPSYGANGQSVLPPPIEAWYWLMTNACTYGFLLWYFDSVIPNEYGMCRIWFPFTRDYWGIRSQSANINRLSWQKQNAGYAQPDEAGEDSEVRAERQRALDPGHFPALKIVNLRKVYYTFYMSKVRRLQFSESIERKVAVRDSCFTVEEGKLLALLGQNGIHLS